MSRPPTARDARFEEIVAAHQKLVRDAIAHVCPRDLGLQIDDIEQEVRIRLWRALERETDIRDAASYLYKIARTATIDAIRRVKARREEQLELTNAEVALDRSSPPAADRSPERLVEQRDTFQSGVQGVVAPEPGSPSCRGLAPAGLDAPEIARLMNWSESRTKNLVYRGLADLRKQLGEAGVDYDHD